VVFHNLLQSGDLRILAILACRGIRMAIKLPPSVYAGVYVHEQTGTGANIERQSGVKKLGGNLN
jgi:hypothetical protein